MKEIFIISLISLGLVAIIFIINDIIYLFKKRKENHEKVSK